MAIRIVELGSNRVEGEGPRIGTVRRPPRGVPKAKFSSGNWYDVWYPNLAPSIETMKLAQEAQTEAEWEKFVKKFRLEMAAPEASRSLDLLATFSHSSVRVRRIPYLTGASLRCRRGDEAGRMRHAKSGHRSRAWLCAG